MKTKKNLFMSLILLCLVAPLNAKVISIRDQVVQSEEFLEFKRQRFTELRQSKTDNTYIQCLRDEHQRITPPRPSFSDYYSVRHPEYIFRESKYIINKTEACIEHHYFSSRCDAHHDSSLDCDGNVFSTIGQVDYTEEKNIISRPVFKEATFKGLSDEKIRHTISI